MRRFVATPLLVAVAAHATAARAEPPVVVPPDDTRTHAVVSRRSVALSLWATRLGGDTSASWLQLGLGPSRWKLPFRGASMGELDRWSGRARIGLVVPDGRGTSFAPLTLGAQRISVYDTLSAAPLIHLQTGIELAISTPWLSDRRLDPGETGAAVHSADTELVDNGWSLRPLSWHVRADALACRSIYVEVGVGPELFRSTAHPERGADYGLRWHTGGGVSLACPALTRRFLDDLTVVVQYSARALLYNRDDGAAYADRLLFALQLQRGRWALAALTSVDARILGIRIQVEAGGPSR